MSLEKDFTLPVKKRKIQAEMYDQNCNYKSTKDIERKSGDKKTRDYYVLSEHGYSLNTLSWNELFGVENIKKELQEIAEYRKAHGKFLINRIILYGLPGCGKNRIAKTFGSGCGLAYITIAAEELLNSFIISSFLVDDAFNYFRNETPCVLYINKFDVLSDAREAAQYIAKKIDELVINYDICIIGSVEDLGLLPPELAAPRFPKIISVPLPDKETRKSIFKLKLSKYSNIIINTDLDMLAEVTDKYTGDDIGKLCIFAKYKCINEFKMTNTCIQVPVISNHHFNEALVSVERSLSDDRILQNAIFHKLFEEFKEAFSLIQDNIIRYGKKVEEQKSFANTEQERQILIKKNNEIIDMLVENQLEIIQDHRQEKIVNMFVAHTQAEIENANKQELILKEFILNICKVKEKNSYLNKTVDEFINEVYPLINSKYDK